MQQYKNNTPNEDLFLVVKCLTSMPEAMSSNLNTTKINKLTEKKFLKKLTRHSNINEDETMNSSMGGVEGVGNIY